jgi:large conductance mechanosensitive channel
MFAEFKKFALKGNVLDMAVGIIIGAAFGTVVKSMVDDVLMPPIGRLLGGADMSDLFINLSGGSYASLAEAQEAGAATINYGIFLNNVVSFLIVAFAVFLLVRGFNRMRERLERKEEAAAPTETDCPFCRFKVPLAAVRCGHCTSSLEGVTV